MKLLAQDRFFALTLSSGIKPDKFLATFLTMSRLASIEPRRATWFFTPQEIVHLLPYVFIPEILEGVVF
jgi:hypothetical protein